MYFKIYGSYFLQSPLCFFMDVIMSKKREFFSEKCNINTATCAMKNVPIVVRCRHIVIHIEIVPIKTIISKIEAKFFYYSFV